MNKIESKEDFMNWNKRVNTARILCDLQDEFAHSDIKKLGSIYLDMAQNEKELTIFCVQKAMGSATLFEFVRLYAVSVAEKRIQVWEKDINDRENALFEKEREIKKENDQLHLTLELLEKQNADLVKSNNEITKQYSDAYQKIIKLEGEATEYKKKIAELVQFENHIKSLLN